MRKLILTLCLASLTISVSAQTMKNYSDFNPAQKKEIARLINQELSQYAGTKIDEVTTITSMVFLQGMIQVSNSVDMEYYGNTVQELKEFIPHLAPVQTNTICTHPSLRNMIDLGFDFKYIYYTTEGIYIYEYKITPSDCK